MHLLRASLAQEVELILVTVSLTSPSISSARSLCGVRALVFHSV